MGQELRKSSPAILEDEIMAYEPERWRVSLQDKLEFGRARYPEFGPARLDIRSHTLQLAGTDKSLPLSPFEYQILWLLLRARGTNDAYVSSEEISEFIYQNLPEGSLEKILHIENLIAQEICSLRGKIGSFTKEVFIGRHKPGFGYRLGSLHAGDNPNSLKGSKKAGFIGKYLQMRSPI